MKQFMINGLYHEHYEGFYHEYEEVYIVVHTDKYRK